MCFVSQLDSMHSEGFQIAVLASRKGEDCDEVLTKYRDISRNTQFQLEEIFIKLLCGKL